MVKLHTHTHTNSFAPMQEYQRGGRQSAAGRRSILGMAMVPRGSAVSSPLRANNVRHTQRCAPLNTITTDLGWSTATQIASSRSTISSYFLTDKHALTSYRRTQKTIPS
jgi:hypothetical protein